MRSLKINCTACGRTALIRTEPVYEGFKKIGEVFICTQCGEHYDSADTTPFIKRDAQPQVFSADDKPAALSIFSEDERRRCCGWCNHFVVNPFSQRCGLSNRDTQATDLCAGFEKKPDADCEENL